MAKLTERQKRFADEYLIDLNATQAAKRAGYKDPSIGRRLITQSHVLRYIEKKQNRLEKKLELSQEKILSELASVAFASITDYLEYKTIIREVDKDRDGNPQYDWAMSVLAKDSNEVDGAPIQEVSVARDGAFKFKMYNKLDALEKIGRHLGMFDKSGEPKDVEALAGLAELLARK